MNLHRQRNQEIDDAMMRRQAEREHDARHRKDKRKNGSVVAPRGDLETKLRKSFGGKFTQRTIVRERHAWRRNPDEINIFDMRDPHDPQPLCRSVDFALVLGRGDPLIVVADSFDKDALRFVVDDEFAATLARTIRHR